MTAILFAAVLIAACGGSGPGGSTGTSTTADAVHYAECMRSHGIPDFPDPGSNGHSTLDLSLSQSHSVSGISVDGHKLQETSAEFFKASRACVKYSPEARAPKISTAELDRAKAGALKMAECMRSHGVPGFPDPQVQTGPNGHGLQIGISTGRFGSTTGAQPFNPNSPAFRAAQKLCNPTMQHYMPASPTTTNGS